MKAHLTKWIKHPKLFFILIIPLIIMIFSTACAKQMDSHLITCHLDEHSSYPKAVKRILPAYTIEQLDNQPYYILDSGAITEAFDTQAVGALETNIAQNWYPHYLATVIIAMDRRQTDMVITSWEDLSRSQEDVSFFNTAGNIQMLIAAMAYGLEGPNYTLTKAIHLMASLHQGNLLKINSFDAPIIICYDYQAARMIKNGRKLEIIIPTDGTFTYQKGLLSNKELDFSDSIDKVLLESDLRLLNGQDNPSIYPKQEAYSSAVRVRDYKYFAKVIRDVSCRFERNVLNSKRFMSIDNREHLHFALLYIVIITIWTASIMRRSMQKGITYSVFFMSIILNGWIFVRLIKYQVELNPALSRYLWYGFYFFQLTLPLVLLWMAWVIDKADREIVPPKWWYNMAICIAGLILLVFTNDLHGWVLDIDLNRPDWEINYGYGPGYYVILLICFINLIATMMILLKKSIKNPRKKGVILPFIVFLMFAIYNYQYIMRDPFVYATDLTIITGLFAMLMFEVCIRSGLIPVNTKYIQLFTYSPLQIQILDQRGRMVLASRSALGLTDNIIKQVVKLSPISIFQEDDSVVFANPIPGGYVVWQDDVRKLYQLHRDIKKSMEMLTEANAILDEEKKLKESINQKVAKKQLMEQLEAEIAGSIDKLSTMIERLASARNHLRETTRIALLLCYVKRRCNLFFKEQEKSIMDTEKLIHYIDELSEVAQYVNVQITTIQEIEEDLAIRYAILFYDLAYSVADLAVRTNYAYTIQHIVTTGEFCKMGFLISEKEEDFKLEPNLMAAIHAVKGQLVVKDLEDAIGISISFPKGGDVYD